MSLVWSFPSYSSPLHDEDSSSWWEGVCEAADLLSGRQGQSRDIEARRMLPTQQEKMGCYFAKVSDCLHMEECTSVLATTVPTSSATHARSVPNEKRSSPSDQKIAAAKLSLNSGTEHVNYSGKKRKARQLKKCCHEYCNRCEEPRLNLAQRREIFNTFWSLSNHERQWLFIYGSVKTTTPSNKSSVRGGKHTTRSYYFSLAGAQKRVCKTMFKNTLCICDSWIDSALSHFSNDGYKPDMRGKMRSAQKRNKVTERTVFV